MQSGDRGGITTFPLLQIVIGAANGRKGRDKRVRKACKKNACAPHLAKGPIDDICSARASALQKAGLDPGLHLHDLCRTFRTHMNPVGVDSSTLNGIMGHANPKIGKAYSRLSDDHPVRATVHIPDRNAHKTGATARRQEKRAAFWTHATP